MFRNIIIPQPTGAMPPRVPPPSHRHGAPSGPWPFLNIDSEVDPAEILDPWSQAPLSASCVHAASHGGAWCWCKYPQALFPNWTPSQQRKSRISKVVEKSVHDASRIYQLDVLSDGRFVGSESQEVTDGNKEAYWELIRRERPRNVRVRAFFVENMTGPVLQMLGTKFNIEPFFFSSSIGWIPSRFQENIQHAKGDHITITLTFIRSVQNPTTVPPSPESNYSASTMSRTAHKPQELVIDTQAPLGLRSSDLILLPDLLALHMIRSPSGSTIISYHPGMEHHSTTAQALHTRFHSTGRSVYWNTIMNSTKDPTVVFLSLLWYPLYAWDEALERLYAHICYLESRVIAMNDMELTQELHIVRAHLLHYESLLEDFRKTVTFMLATPYPGLDSPSLFSPEEKGKAQELMKRECGNLLREIKRLEKSRGMQDMRLKNVMDLGFNSINIEDSRRMQKLTEATVRDSAAMKQIAYLTMFFLPATFVAAAFGMNVAEINPGSNPTLSQYFACAIPLTAITIWIIVAFQIQIKQPRQMQVASEKRKDIYNYSEDRDDSETIRKLGMWSRLWWPAVLFSALFERRKERRRKTGIIVGDPPR